MTDDLQERAKTRLLQPADTDVASAVVAGMLLSAWFALTPLTAVGYVLRVNLLLAGLCPHVLYAMGAWLRRDALRLLLGPVLLASQWLVCLPLHPLPELSAADQDYFLWSALASIRNNRGRWQETLPVQVQPGGDSAWP